MSIVEEAKRTIEATNLVKCANARAISMVLLSLVERLRAAKDIYAAEIVLTEAEEWNRIAMESVPQP